MFTVRIFNIKIWVIGTLGHIDIGTYRYWDMSMLGHWLIRSNSPFCLILIFQVVLFMSQSSSHSCPSHSFWFLRLHDPINSQSVLSYSFSQHDDWKLEAWRKLFICTAGAAKDFIIPIKEVKIVRQNRSNLFIRYNRWSIPCCESRELFMCSPQVHFHFFISSCVNFNAATLRDVARSLVNNRSILLKDSVMSQSVQTWDTTGTVLKKFKSQNAKLGPPKAVVVSKTGVGCSKYYLCSFRWVVSFPGFLKLSHPSAQWCCLHFLRFQIKTKANQIIIRSNLNVDCPTLNLSTPSESNWTKTSSFCPH